MFSTRSGLYGLAILAGISLLVVVGCGDEQGPGEEEECAGRGELHGDHCHCDVGYTPSDDMQGCLKEDIRVPDDDPSNNGEGDRSDLTFTPSNMIAATGTAEDGSQLRVLEASTTDTVLSIEIYEGFGGPSSPGVVTMDADEGDYLSCSTCIILQTGCTTGLGGLTCDTTFMPRAEGVAEIDAIGSGAGDRLAGELRGLVFQEVTIGSDYRTRPVSGGHEIDLATWQFDVELQDLDVPPAECDGHGHLHGSHCHCDPGYQADPADPTRCIPQ